MSTPGTNPPPPGSNVKDPREHTDGGMPTDPRGIDVNANADVKVATPSPKPAK